MRSKRFKNYIAVVEDADGVSYQYVSSARSRQHAESEARESVEQWGATLVGIKPAEARRVEPRRMARVVAVTVVATVLAISAAIFIALKVEGIL